MKIGRNRGLATFAVTVLLLFSVMLACAQGATVKESDREMARRVMERLLSLCERGPDYMTWPPELKFGDSEVPNACAQLRPVEGSKVMKSFITIEAGEFTHIVRGSESVLALDIGHELGHLVLGHFEDPCFMNNSPFVLNTAQRENEYAADRKGMELLLAGGYSYRESLKSFSRLIEMDLDFPPAIAGRLNHPASSDRLARLDKEQPHFWTSMSAFTNGTFFLATEQYAPAERCFARVTRDFPTCYEGWANLGYARLMIYFEGLDQDALRRFNVGHIVCGSFYTRPLSMVSSLRGGFDEEMWSDAVAALQEALRLKSDLVLAKANLGIAYLIHPSGQKEIGRATRYLVEAAEGAERDTTLPPLAKASVLINAGVAYLCDNQGAQCASNLVRAQEIITKVYTDRKKTMDSMMLSEALALLFNQALLLESQGKPSEAAKSLERYLEYGDRSSPWWDVAYARYSRMTILARLPAKSRSSFTRLATPGLRPAFSVDLGQGKSVMLSQKMSEVLGALGPAAKIPVAQGFSLYRYAWPERGLEVIGVDDVLAICLKGENAPALNLRPYGVGTEAISLKAGMAKEKLDTLLGQTDYDYQPLVDQGTMYRFYRKLGVAARIKGGIVTELVVAQIPEK